MPTGLRREDTFIEAFLSAYDDLSWANADKDWLDRRLDKAVEILATRKSDGKTLAIEHTLVEPFVSDKEDYAFFELSFLKIENDHALVVPDRGINVFIPVGTLHGHHRTASRDAIVKAVHEWIRANRLNLADGQTKHRCRVTGIQGAAPFEITLTIKSISIPGRGSLHVRRQQVNDDLSDVIEKALRKKLPKLAAQTADKRILILERQHMNLLPERILDEIEKQRTVFSDLSAVDEIWILETIGYEQSGYFRFELYRGGDLISDFDFQNGTLTSRFENGMWLPI
jgi:hypothetical protein